MKPILLSVPHMGGLESDMFGSFSFKLDFNRGSPLARLSSRNLNVASACRRWPCQVVLRRSIWVCGFWEWAPGDEVFCQDLTFVASANPIRYQGATPVFLDSDYETWNMDPEILAVA